MVKNNLNKIFLSASIPSPDRHKKFYDTADIVAIRDSVRALATVVIPQAHLIWGGHPSITPLIRYVLDRLKVNLKDHVTLYQSLFFEDKFPDDNFAFENIVLTAKANTLSQSLSIMRETIMEENHFQAAIFIGGMDGIDDEFNLFSHYYPDKPVFPLASTGAAAGILYDKLKQNGYELNNRLENDYAYMALLKYLLNDYIK